MAATVALSNGRRLTRDQAERYLELRREQYRRNDLRRLETEREAVLAKCQTLHGFIEEFWYVLEPASKFVMGPAIRAMCDHLEAVHYGHIQNLLITVPPGMMKSLLVSVFFQAWEWGPKARPDLRYLATSYSEANVHRDSAKVRKLIESEKYQALWGDKVAKTAKWGDHKFENTAGGNRDCRPFGSLTGGRGDRVLIDDPHSTKTAESDDVRQATVTQFREGATDRLNDIAVSATIVIMQRLHEQDVAGEILKLDIGYVHLNLPMEFEPDRRCRTVLRPANDGNPAVIFEDWRTTPGELLFPERFPADALAKLKKAKGSYAWAGQYQQRPAPREGGMFKRSWFGTVGAIPAAAVDKCRAWDFGGTEDDGDYTAGLKGSYDPISGLIVLEGMLRDQLSPGGVRRLVKGAADVDGVGCRIRIPKDPAQAGKDQAMSYITLLAGYAVKAVPPTGSKVVRADAARAQAEVGNIVILVTGDPDRDAWIEPFLDEVCLFPAGSNDDQVDALADLVNELALPSMKAAGAFELARREAEALAAAEAAEAADKPKIEYAPGSLEWMQAIQAAG